MKQFFLCCAVVQNHRQRQFVLGGCQWAAEMLSAPQTAPLVPAARCMLVCFTTVRQNAAEGKCSLSLLKIRRASTGLHSGIINHKWKNQCLASEFRPHTYTQALHEIYLQSTLQQSHMIHMHRAASSFSECRQLGEWERCVEEGWVMWSCFSPLSNEAITLRHVGFIQVLVQEAWSVNPTARNSFCNTIHQEASISLESQSGTTPNKEGKGRK